MIYRNFAIAILLAAPLIVMATQSVLPQPEQPVAQAGAPSPPVPVPVAPPVSTQGAPAMVDPPSSFGQPMAGADQPALAPGSGLPDTSPPPINGDAASGLSQGGSAAGSLNAGL